MSWIDGLRYRLRSVLRRRELEAEREAEFGFHQSLEEAEQRARGLTPVQARLASRRRFGSSAYYREEIRRTGLAGTLEAVGREVRQAVRSLRRSPGFSAAAVLTLALGLGGLAGVGTVTWSVLLEPLPFPESSRLVSLWLRYPSLGIEARDQSDATFFTLARLNRSLQGLAAYRVADVNLGDATNPERVTGAQVSAGFFPTLQVGPLRGRLLSTADDRPGAAPVVVLSEGLWRRRFGADPGVVGRTIDVDGRAHEVIGILPSSATHPESAQLWSALRLDPDHALPSRGALDLIGRLKPAATLAAATADLQAAHDRMPDFFPDAGFGLSTRRLLELGKPRLLLHHLRDDVVGDVGDVLWVLVGTAAFVLLIACANVATLFLVRAEARQREVAVRAALGAGQGRLRRAALAEALVLAVAGGALGGGLASLGVRLLANAAGARIPRLGAVGVDGVVVAGIVTLTVLVALALGLLPARRILPVALVLRAGGRGATGGRERQRVRQLLVAAQVALAFALLAGSGLLARSYLELRRVRPGFDPAGVLTARVALPEATYRTTADVTRFYLAAMDRLRSLPGVAAVGGASRAPLGPGDDDGNTIMVEGRPLTDAVHVSGKLVYVAGDHFRALGMRLLAGRPFGRLDPDRARNEVIVSRAFASEQWGDATGQAALGQRVRLTFSAPWLTVVGVVEDSRRASLAAPPVPTLYLPTTVAWVDDSAAPTRASDSRIAAIAVPRQLAFLVRATGRPADLAAPVRVTVHDLDPSLPLFDVVPLDQVVSASMARTTFTGWMLAAAAAIALLLGVIGVYGVIAYTVGMRTRELGLRLALGAKPGAVRWMVVRQGVGLVAAGIAGGLALTVLVTGLMQALLFGVSRLDPMTLIVVTATLAVAAIAASWIPAARAGRVDPAVTLAGE